MKKKIIIMLIGLSLSMGIVGCSNSNEASTNKANTMVEEGTSESTTASSSENTINIETISSIDISSGESESVGEVDAFITLGDNITIDGSGATTDNNKVTIDSAGTYSLSGSLNDGQIIINADDDDKVYLILNGVSLTCSDSAPIYAMNSDKIVISLADGTENYIKDGDSYVFEDKTNEEPNAAIFSKSDLTIIGNGSLVVDGNFGDGIASKDDLKIESGNITVNAVNDGIKGKDSVVITNGEITINAGADGVKSDNDKDVEKGYVLIENGHIYISSVEEGIEAKTNALIKNGNIMINSTDSKGIKAVGNIVIEGGIFNITTYDDALHSNKNLVINDGTFNITAGDDGIHADYTLVINSGDINIMECSEGIESENITINNGNVNVVSSDDAINCISATGNGSSKKNMDSANSNIELNINGGNVTINSGGDGLDSNGSFYMTDGVVIVNGPTDDRNGYLDYDGIFEISGGLLIASGSAGMAEAPSTTSTQNSVKVTLAEQSANTKVNIKSNDGEEILTFTPIKDYQSFVVSSSALKKGSTYTVYAGNTDIGKFTISTTVTELVQEGITISQNNRSGVKK
jgi:hypothetical protein